MRFTIILLILCALPCRADIGNGDFTLPSIGTSAAGWSGDWTAWQRIDGAATITVRPGVWPSITNDTLLPAGRSIIRFRSRRLTPMDDSTIVLHIYPSHSILCRFESDRWQAWSVEVDSPVPWRLTLSAYVGWVTPPSVVPLVRIAVDDVSVELLEPAYGAGMALGGAGWP